jgi:hypothetical protein
MIDRQVKRLCYLKSLASVERLGSSKDLFLECARLARQSSRERLTKYNHRKQFRETECENL